ncbi:MAG: hypothetical protein PHS82_12680 [Lachnospiraceae bacterium]|nr:hypothetical protein [Lachnospiraceae bacterium]
MSQEKVDKYKEYKANKAKILKREKFMHRLEMTGIAIVCVAFIGWFGFSIYQSVTAKDTSAQSVTELDVTAFDEYLSGLSTADAE